MNTNRAITSVNAAPEQATSQPPPATKDGVDRQTTERTVSAVQPLAILGQGDNTKVYMPLGQRFDIDD